MATCGSCRGSGTVTCTFCGGRGTTSRVAVSGQLEMSPCGVCGGRRSTLCMTCMGSGQVPPFGAPPGEFVPARTAMPGALRRSRSDKWIAGVCAGLGKRLGMSTGLVRFLFFVLSAFSAAFPGIIIYIILWVALPREPE